MFTITDETQQIDNAGMARARIASAEAARERLEAFNEQLAAQQAHHHALIQDPQHLAQRRDDRLARIDAPAAQATIHDNVQNIVTASVGTTNIIQGLNNLGGFQPDRMWMSRLQEQLRNPNMVAPNVSFKNSYTYDGARDTYDLATICS